MPADPAFPGGSGTQVQYRAGVVQFGGIASSSYDGTTLTLPQTQIGTRAAIGTGATIAGTSLLFPATNYKMTLLVQESYTDVATTAVGTWLQAEANPSANTAAGVYGLISSSYVKSTNDKNIGAMYGAWMEVNHAGSGVLANAYGSYSVSNINAGANATTNYGLVAEALGGTDLYGIQIRANKNASQGITQAGTCYGLYANVTHTGAISSGTDTTYGVVARVVRTGATGGTLNTYGVWSNITVDNAGAGSHFTYDFYATARTGSSDADYFLWFASPGVYRIKADGIMAYYNPTFSPAYTPNATDYERVVQQWNTNVLEYGLEASGTGTLRPMRFLGSYVEVKSGLLEVGGTNHLSIYHLADNAFIYNRVGETRFATANVLQWTMTTFGHWISSGNQNVGLGLSAFGTNATKTLALGTGVAPTTSPADCFQLYSADQAAGNACPHVRTENGVVLKIFQHAGIADADGTLSDLTTKFNSLLAKLEADGTLAAA